jgi:type IV secretion system protein VirD4
LTRFASAPWPLKAAYVGGLSAAGAAAFTGLTGVIALAGLHRLSAHLDFAAVPGWFWYFRHDPKVRHWLGAGLMVAFSAAAWVAASVVRNLRPTLYGAARWATEAEVRRAGLRTHPGILLGRKGGELLSFGGAEHVLLYAPTRTGKGVGVVIPNLLAWPDSVVVLDVKGENWEATAGFRAAHGQRVLAFDPLNAEGRTARFNPLGHIDRTDPFAVLDELQKLAVMLFPAPHNGDPFWAESARTGLIGMGAYVAATPELPFSLGAIYAQLTEGDPRTRFPPLLAALRQAGTPLSPGAASALSDFCSASENTFASIKQTITSRMNLWLNPRVCAATDVSDFDLRDLRTHRLSLYLTVSPDNLARVAPLYNLLLQQLIDLNTRERPSGDRHQVPVLVLLDEFARLGHARVIAHGFSYVAGYGLRLLPVLQSPAQLRAEYGADLAEEIIANCGVEIAFAPKELKIAQELSGRIGDYTYEGRSRSRPTGLAKGSHSSTESDQRRPLMLPQELMQMPDDRLILLRANLPAVRGRKIVYWRERLFMRRLQPAPTVPRHPGVGQAAYASPPAPPTSASSPDSDLRLDLIALADNLEPLPPEGASEADMAAWVERYIDATVQLPGDPDHGR